MRKLKRLRIQKMIRILTQKMRTSEYVIQSSKAKPGSKPPNPCHGGLRAQIGSSTNGLYSQLVPSLQAMQFSAATGISRILIILGLLKPAIMGDNIAEDLIQRQSSAVDEHFFLNESASQVREISKFKPLSSRTSVSVIIGDSFDEQIPAHLNHMVAQLQKTFMEQTYPLANQIHVKGGDRRMIYKRPSVVSKHLWKLVSQRQSKQQSQ
ncbi:unnamed protein product [Coregonus sp. 'balchen']|nr:unnamed protein product [Coregonus sp. 'balchen']